MTWFFFSHFDMFWHSSHKCSFSIDHYELVNNWGFVWMVKTPNSKDIITHVQIWETILFHHPCFPTRHYSEYPTFYTFFKKNCLMIFLMFIMFAYPTNALIFSSLCVHVFGPWTMLLFSFIASMSSKLNNPMKLKKSKMSNVGCNLLWAPWQDLHVHEPWWQHWHIQKAWEKNVKQTLINICMKMHGQVIFELIIGNLICDHFHFVIFHHFTFFFFCLILEFFWVALLNFCIMYGVFKLWVMGLQQLFRPNQDTQASIESFYGVLKHWFSLDIKGLRGCWVNWLVWRLTTTIAHHYMHTMEMRKKVYIEQGHGGHCEKECGKSQP